MLIVPEREIANLMTRAATFDAVEQVFAAMAAGDAYYLRRGLRSRWILGAGESSTP